MVLHIIPTRHSSKDAGGVTKPGNHIKSNGTPIANLWLSMINAMGIKLINCDSTGKLKLS